MNKKTNSTSQGYELVNFCEFDKFAVKSYCAIHGVDESLNLGDITKVDETKLKPFNMICGGSPCFVKGTSILTKNGYKNIEDVSVGDMVYTKDGNWKQVLRTGSDGEKDVYDVHTLGSLPIKCTDNHPFWSRRATLKTIGDGETKISLEPPEKRKLCELNNYSDYIGIPIVKDIENFTWELSDETLQLIGEYIVNHHPISKQEFPELYYAVSNLHFGECDVDYTIPVELLQLPKDKLKIVLDCCIHGSNSLSTVSKYLAQSLVLAIQKAYSCICGIFFYDELNHYDVLWSKADPLIVDDSFIWYQVFSIDKCNEQEKIYNIEIADDHTYLANNVAVFNCQDFSVSGKQAGSMWTCKDCVDEDGNPYSYNPLTVHYSVRDQCPHCGSKNIDKTRSSLLVEWLRIIRANKPTWGIYENVKNIVGKRFKDTFDMFIQELHEYGYNTYYKVLNAKDYGIPQNRERVYLIIILKEYDNGKFVFPEGFDNGKRLKDMLEDDVDEKFYVNTPKAQELIERLILDGKLDKDNPNTFVLGRDSLDSHQCDLVNAEN